MTGVPETLSQDGDKIPGTKKLIWEHLGKHKKVDLKEKVPLTIGSQKKNDVVIPVRTNFMLRGPGNTIVELTSPKKEKSLS